MSSNDRNLIITDDGSHSVFVPHLKEQYHSTHGAVTESLHVFINAGFRFILLGHAALNILEVGFGTGLNALLTYTLAEQLPIAVHYYAIEPMPLPEEIIARLNYPSLTGLENTEVVFSAIHKVPFNAASAISDHFVLNKIPVKFEEYTPPPSFFDLVYYDAFSPAVQPELWTREVFDIAAKAMKPGAVLVTYCCKGDVKRHLKAAGFVVKKLPGPPGKREMLRAIKIG